MTRQSPIYNFAAELDRQCREEYELYLESWMTAAENRTNGHLVNVRGQERSVHARQLITGTGHHMNAIAYGTEEFHDFLRNWPVKTYTRFEADWLSAYKDGRIADD